MFDSYDLIALKSSWGVYAIIRLDTGRQYIGGTGDSFWNRWKGHWYSLEKGSHDNKALQWDWFFFGYDRFEFRILELYTGKDLYREGLSVGPWVHHREAVAISRLQNLYNVSMPAASTLSGDQAQCQSSRRWEAFYGSPPPLCPNHDWWKNVGKRNG